ncbi:hypothetical protein LOAG_04591 [Loa loa]|uniref:Uncharacterized protein n=1 Tax=Loa loa TaxID=7209 RepID=A0A1S0U223_LOALO|nr:hypothetical protein LOAG_04591 [Loa loa]EFO23891.1 hypothetical protein LOAG_04591 [Loa loa]
MDDSAQIIEHLKGKEIFSNNQFPLSSSYVEKDEPVRHWFTMKEVQKRKRWRSEGRYHTSYSLIRKVWMWHQIAGNSSGTQRSGDGLRNPIKFYFDWRWLFILRNGAPLWL